MRHSAAEGAGVREGGRDVEAQTTTLTAAPHTPSSVKGYARSYLEHGRAHDIAAKQCHHCCGLINSRGAQYLPDLEANLAALDFPTMIQERRDSLGGCQS